MRRLLIASIFVGAIFSSFAAFAWTGPSQSPTGGNVAAPINAGASPQTKNGTLGVNGLAVFGNSLLSGSNRYLNWGTTAGDTGYGIRDNAGTMEFKNSGGIWASLNTSIQNYLSLGAVTQVKFSNGTTQTTAASDVPGTSCGRRTVYCGWVNQPPNYVSPDGPIYSNTPCNGSQITVGNCTYSAAYAKIYPSSINCPSGYTGYYVVDGENSGYGNIACTKN